MISPIPAVSQKFGFAGEVMVGMRRDSWLIARLQGGNSCVLAGYDCNHCGK